jgi:hypothetical protein
MSLGKCQNCKKINQKLDRNGNCRACYAVSAGENFTGYILDKIESWATQYIPHSAFKIILGGIVLLALYIYTST